MLLPGPSLSPLGPGRRRRATPNTPAAGYALWLKADAGVLDGSGNPATDGASVATWQDQSGNANHATQSTSGSRPTFKAAIVNGKPVVRFGGSQFLALTASIGSYPVTAFVVGQFSPTGAPQTWFCGAGGSLQFRVDSSPIQQAIKSFVFGLEGGATTLSYSTPYLFESRYDGSTCDLWLDGASDDGTQYSTVATSAPVTAVGANPAGGPGEFLNGDIAEIVFYPSALSDADRAATEAYLNGKYLIY